MHLSSNQATSISFWLARECRLELYFKTGIFKRKNSTLKLPFVNSGTLKTGREHYFTRENEPAGSSNFCRTNDILTGVGVGI